MEWFESPSHRLVMRLSLSVHLTDDLTGTPIRGSNARVWIDGQKPPIRKGDGRHIFVDLPAGDYLLHAEGGLYTHTQYVCNVCEDKAASVTIRLTPNPLYPVPPDAVRIEGITSPEAVVRVYTADKLGAYKLLSDIQKGSRVIGIFHPTGITLDGKLLKLLTADGRGECIRVIASENSDRFEYLLEQALTSDFPKIGTVIAPMSECIADSSGRFMLLIPRTQRTNEVICEVQEKAQNTVRQTTLTLPENSYLKADL